MSGGLEVECQGVDAIALATRWRAVIENVPKVGVAAAAAHFDAVHAVAVVGMLINCIRRACLTEAGPAATRFEFGAGIEQVAVAAHTGIGAAFRVRTPFPGKWRFSGRLPTYGEPLIAQLLPPLRIGFVD